ncbi:hypothetical protein GCM10023085_06570 [Actinomadura viridis]|uniref:Uncharacterized protein n=1 Tax=Actinomadura viridis TaxID=58110 RepID=A0A931DS32_9ACTN|nr:hypothetical protein [Actinomadura viridis]MBG6091673.1 hypothetical protein [Actinomadura viridis]
MSGTAAGLLSRVGPDLYRENPFRVAGLGVDATARDIRRRSEELQVKARLGTDPDPSSPLLPLVPPPDLAAAREAMQRLRDPVARLQDELFWFWPAPDGDPDEGLDALRAGAPDRAERVWGRAGSGPAAAVARHNLAVLLHARALDADGLPATGRDLWRRALTAWSAVLDDAAFWDLVTERARRAADPRLGSGTARDLRDRLPAALLSVSARLAVRVAREDGGADAAWHADLMTRCGFPDALVTTALRDAAGTDTSRLRSLGEAALAKATAEPSRGAEQAARVLDQAAPGLAGLEAVLPPGDSLLQGIQDEVAAHAMRCAVLYVNETGDFPAALPLLERALDTAATEANRAHVERNLATVRQNLVHTTCWFCKERPSEDGAVHEQPMHGEVQRRVVARGYNARQIQTTWRKTVVRVPRCAPCAETGHRRTRNVWGVGCTTNIVVLVLGIWMLTAGMVAGGIVLLVLDLVGFFTVAGLAGNNGLSPGQLASLREFPPIKEQLAAGWAFGEKPPDAGG